MNRKQEKNYFVKMRERMNLKTKYNIIKCIKIHMRMRVL